MPLSDYTKNTRYYLCNKGGRITPPRLDVFLLLVLWASLVAAGEARGAFSDREYEFIVECVQPSHGQPAKIRLSSDVLISTEDYLRFVAQVGYLSAGDRVKAHGYWERGYRGSRKLYGRKVPPSYYFLAFKLELIARAPESQKAQGKATPLPGGGPGEGATARTEEAEREKEKAERVWVGIDKLRPIFRRYPSEHYDVYYDGPRDYPEKVSRYFETLYQKFCETLAGLRVKMSTPAERLATVIFQNSEEYAQTTGVHPGYCPGFYSPGENTLYTYDLRTHPYGLLKDSLRDPHGTVRYVTNDGTRMSALGVQALLERWIREMEAEVMIHEATHQLCHSTGFFTQTGDAYPSWLVEGIAQYFQHPRYWNFLERPAGNINVSALQTLQKQICQGRWIELAELLLPNGSFRLSFPDRVYLAYAQSWALLYYLLHGEGGRYRRPLGEYVHHLNNLKEAEKLEDEQKIRLFRKFFQVDPEALEQKLKDFVMNLREEKVFIPAQ